LSNAEYGTMLGESANKSRELLGEFMRKNDVSGVHLGKWRYQ